MVGSFFGMLVQPLGFGTWQAGATLVPGFLAKVIVSSMAIIYSSGDAGLVNVIQKSIHTAICVCIYDIYTIVYSLCFYSGSNP